VNQGLKKGAFVAFAQLLAPAGQRGDTLARFISGGESKESEMPNKKTEGRFKDAAFFTTTRGRSIAGAAAAAGVAGLGAFLWTKRDRIGDAFNSGLDRLSEFKAERMKASDLQAEIVEEALSRKEADKKSGKSRRPIAQQEIKVDLATVS